MFAFDDECGRPGVGWALVTSPSVRMTLRAGDRDGILPSAGSVVEGLQWFRDRTRQRGLLQFVSHKTQAGSDSPGAAARRDPPLCAGSFRRRGSRSLLGWC